MGKNNENPYIDKKGNDLSIKKQDQNTCLMSWLTFVLAWW